MAFEAEINPLSIKKFSILQTKKPCEAFNSDLSSIDKADYFELSNSFLKVKISKKSGYISSIFNKQLQKEFVKREAFIPIVIEDQGDAWGTGEDAFRKIVDKFALVRGKNVGEYSSGRREVGKGVRVVEKGDVRIKAEAIFSCNGCCLTAAYTLSRKDPLLRIDYDILWTKKRHMLKISLPLNLTFSSVLAEIPYGAIKLKADGKENVYQRWLLVENKNQGIGLINNGQYAFDAFKNEIRLNILRSAVYCHHNEYILKKNRTYQTMDMGYHNISFGIITDKAENLRKKVPLFARNFNLTPDALVAFPSNKNKFEIPPFPINIDNNQVVCEAIKKAEDGEGYIARFFEVTGKKCNIRLSFFDKNKFVKFLPFEIKTFRFNKKYVKECKLIEDGLN
ncbi:MAG: hypothetical protein HQ547_04525 [Candidatus Omnitrophica bacterium]|nr:hypothetical protein [Candidatus Omnitrophota bacterium]